MTSASERADRLLREPPRLDGVEVLVVVGREADDRLALGLEPRQVCRLVLVALARDEVGVRVLARRRLRDLAAQDGRGELGQVRAGEVGREVGGREQQRAVVGESHLSQYQLRVDCRLRCEETLEPDGKPVPIGSPQLPGRRLDGRAVKPFEHVEHRAIVVLE